MTSQNNQTTRRLLITGATGGMGRACALLAAAEGYDLVLADLSAEKLETVAAQCARHGVAAECHVLDVVQADSITSLVGALATGRGVDAIIHTVGLSPQMAGWEKIIDVDLIGTINFLEAARPQLAAGGCAVCIASMSSYLVPPSSDIEQAMADATTPGLLERLKAMPGPGKLLEHPGMAYAHAKKALRNYVEDGAQAWGSEGKRLVSISPGLIDTEMGRLENDAMDNFEAMKSRVALGRLGRPEEIATTALFLLSAGAAYITGCDILVDGGFVGTVNREQRQRAGT